MMAMEEEIARECDDYTDELAAWMSNAAPTLPIPPSSMSELEQQPFSVVVYNHIVKAEAVIVYPDVSRGWLFRSDASTSTGLRWEYNDTLAVVTRHATCDNAVLPRQRQCRNCEMKRTWRKQCSERCETFFLVALDDAINVDAAVAAVVQDERPLSKFALSRFTLMLPSNAGTRKRMSSELVESSLRAVEAERRFRDRLIKTGRAFNVREQPLLTAADLLIDLAYPLLHSDESVDGLRLAVHAAAAPVAAAAVAPVAAAAVAAVAPVPVAAVAAPAVVTTPSRQMVLVSPRRDPTSPVVLATTVATTDLATVSEAYDALIDTLSPGLVKWSLDDWHAVADSRNFSSSFVRLSRCAALERFVRRIGCGECRWAQLILHPSMRAFMESLRLTIHLCGSVTFGVGVYRAPSVEAYDAMCAASASGRVLINPAYVSTTVDPPGVRPVVVMYRPPPGMVEASNVVPIGAFAA